MNNKQRAAAAQELADLMARHQAHAGDITSLLCEALTEGRTLAVFNGEQDRTNTMATSVLVRAYTIARMADQDLRDVGRSVPECLALVARNYIR